MLEDREGELVSKPRMELARQPTALAVRPCQALELAQSVLRTVVPVSWTLNVVERYSLTKLCPPLLASNRCRDTLFSSFRYGVGNQMELNPPKRQPAFHSA